MLSSVVETIQRNAFRYFSTYTNPCNGLVRDSTQEGSPCSIAAVGFGLTCWPIAVRRGWATRGQALQHTLATLRFFANADMSDAAKASGYRGFFYHFLHMETGERVWDCELSTIDTALLVAGMLFAARFFDGDDAREQEVRQLAQTLYERVDWRWAQNDGAAIALGWTPERGFLPWRWIGYSEALIMYALALGSPSYPASRDAYDEWLSGYRWKRIYGQEHVYAGPLFIHQYSHIWIDFRGIFDAYMRGRGIDYFENSRRATLVHREYAIRNPRGWDNYCGECWGLTASNGPGPDYGRTIDGRKRDFYGYQARGAPFGPDDGTISPWASIASLPFAPDVVLPTIDALAKFAECNDEFFGFYGSFNDTYRSADGKEGWVCPWHIGLNEGPIVTMIENYRDGFIWELMRGCTPITEGLRVAGFRGGWLGG